MLRRLGLWAVPLLCVVATVAAPSGAFAPERISVTLVAARLHQVVVPRATAATRPIPPDFACRKGMAALTFDDGPHGRYTPRLLKILRRENVQASFFVTGQNTTRYPAVVRSALRAGHAVENHSWDHPYLTSLSRKKTASQLSRTSRAIRRATGRSPAYFRPPFGATSKKVRSIARRQGLQQKLWTIDTLDWAGRSVKRIHRTVRQGLRPHRTNVILMHDAVRRSPTSLEAVPGVIREVRARGYCFVPVEAVTPSVVVRSADRSLAEPSKGSSVVPLHVWLDDRTPRRGTIRATFVDGTAKAGRDYVGTSRTVVFGRGGYAHDVGVRIVADPEATGSRYFWLRLDRASALRVGTRKVKVVIRDAQASSAPTQQQLVDEWASPSAPSDSPPGAP
ncbi:MAG: hypothetical protein EON52_00925 [Actinomycetales bacterium]|nr:MAG: hypothetical protein EON52_00925 [Actinomycetales bacterium]